MYVLSFYWFYRMDFNCNDFLCILLYDLYACIPHLATHWQKAGQKIQHKTAQTQQEQEGTDRSH